MSVFTSTPASANVTSPVLFREHGNIGDVACKLGEVDIQTSGFPANTYAMLFKAGHEYAVAAALLNKTVCPMTLPEGYIRAIPKLSPPNFFTTPMVGISYPANMLNPEVESRLSEMGFTRMVVGRLRYFGGYIQPEQIPILPAGGQFHTATAVGVTNLHGLLAFSVTSKILWGCLAARERDLTTLTPLRTDIPDLGVRFVNIGGPESTVNALEFRPPLKENVKTHAYPTSLAADVEEIGLHGFILPYFHNLIIPDYHHVITQLFSNFQHILSDSAETAAKVRSSIRDGWKTLSRTPEGMAISHCLFSTLLALDCGAKPVALFDTERRYLGTCLLIRSKATTVMYKGAKRVGAYNSQQLANALRDLDSHHTALLEIAEYLTATSFTDEDGDEVEKTAIVDCDPSLIRQVSTLRTLHNIFREVKLSDADIKYLGERVKRLHFRQTYLDPKNPLDVLTVLNTIASDGFLPDRFPIYAFSPAMFSNSVALSALSAFGKIAPSFSDPRPGVPVKVPSLKSDVDAKLENVKVGNSRVFKLGIPVFLVDLEKSVSDVKSLMRSGLLNLNINPRGEVINMGARLSMKAEATKKIAQLLVLDFAGPVETKEKKRKREGEEAPSTTEEMQKRAKKQKGDQDGLALLMDLIADDVSFNNKIQIRD